MCVFCVKVEHEKPARVFYNGGFQRTFHEIKKAIDADPREYLNALSEISRENVKDFEREWDRVQQTS